MGFVDHASMTQCIVTQIGFKLVKTHSTAREASGWSSARLFGQLPAFRTGKLSSSLRAARGPCRYGRPPIFLAFRLTSLPHIQLISTYSSSSGHGFQDTPRFTLEELVCSDSELVLNPIHLYVKLISFVRSYCYEPDPLKFSNV
jgi:hypothetical protein